jgi:hypothetical protein
MDEFAQGCLAPFGEFCRARFHVANLSRERGVAKIILTGCFEFLPLADWSTVPPGLFPLGVVPAVETAGYGRSPRRGLPT